MSRKKAEIDPIRAERLKILILREKDLRNGDFSQTKFAESINMSQQNVSRIIKMKQALVEETARHIIEIYPEYRIEWLMGYDDYMTREDQLSSVFNQIQSEGEIMQSAFFGLAKLSGFSVELTRIYHDNSVQSVIGAIKSGFTFRRDGKSVSLSLAELNELENELCDYVEMRLKRKMKDDKDN